MRESAETDSKRVKTLLSTLTSHISRHRYRLKIKIPQHRDYFQSLPAGGHS